ncbi:hypothetical protein EUX98_g1687 [Antrodiella citrinella]|uniref:Uncharacterized protein n=1 Tax=Antrodiella citrinella TaxID=2447956 RepID=A0A4S4N0T9_9APHY|nr:hypothetical protein EUX98_g1687 [Antrodiella citrinella]
MSDSAGTRILVISSTFDQARGFVQRALCDQVVFVACKRTDLLGIKDLPNYHTGTKLSDTPLSSSSDIEHADSQLQTSPHALEGSESIPWTIVNRYYTADVHFETRVLQELRGHHIEGVSAVVYVFNGTEKYKEQVSDLAKLLETYGNNVDVSLAVRVSGATSATGAVVTTASEEEEEGLDEFLSSHALEYIDGDRRGRRPTEDGGGVSDEDPSAVPGLPRVIDSLSTIMWPNMVQSTATKTRKSRARDLLDLARDEEEDDGLRALVSPPHDADDHSGPSSQTISQITSKKSRMQREMDELQKWLEEDEHHSGPLKRSSDHEAWTNPDWTDMPTTPTIRTSHDQESYGFEDDFADFVGAPVEVQYGGRPEVSKTERLIPMHTGASYQSLASFDDRSFASPLASVVDAADDDDDLGLPSQEEIEETTKRIFGQGFSSGLSNLQVPPQSQSYHSLDSPAVFATALAPSPSTSTRDIPLETAESSFAYDDDDEYEMGAFDLSRVLSALQGMKEEISGMQDEDERRKAAARVALGLVYGLQKEEERDLAQDLGGAES